MYSLGIDLGSYGLEGVLINEAGECVWTAQTLVEGEPLKALRLLVEGLIGQYEAESIAWVGVTGSGWRLAKALLGAVYAGEEMELLQSYCESHYPQIASIVKIGYEETAVCHLHQPPKRRGRKNECIRNLGAFHQQQWQRVKMTSEQGEALKAAENAELHISAKCPAFMLRDMVIYEQMGLPKTMIAAKVDEALVRCYLQNTAKDDVFTGEILFTGLLAESDGAAWALALETGQRVWTDARHCFLGAEAAALKAAGWQPFTWRGEAVLSDKYDYAFVRCEDGCERHCSLTQFKINGAVQAVWGGKCDRWDNFIPEQDDAH